MRIVAGTARGRRIAVPSGTTTRPTTDRVREAMFSTLTSVLATSASSTAGGWAGARVIDLCAGSGALGLEAISRGARSAVFIETDRKVAALLRRNIDTIVDHGGPGMAQARTQVIVGDAWSIVRHPDRVVTGLTPADVIFIDAPYETATADIRILLASVITHGWCHEGAIVVVERSARDSESPWQPDERTSREVGEEDRPAGLAWQSWDERRYGETALWYGRCVRLH